MQPSTKRTPLPSLLEEFRLLHGTVPESQATTTRGATAQYSVSTYDQHVTSLAALEALQEYPDDTSRVDTLGFSIPYGNNDLGSTNDRLMLWSHGNQPDLNEIQIDYLGQSTFPEMKLYQQSMVDPMRRTADLSRQFTNEASPSSTEIENPREVGNVSSSSYVRPQHPKIRCTQCPDGKSFTGTHELDRHIGRAHGRRKGYICIDHSEDKRFLADCEQCRSKKAYGANYNAVAHLRRVHFMPRERAEQGQGARRGRGWGNYPSTDHPKEHWIQEVEIDTSVATWRSGA